MEISFKRAIVKAHLRKVKEFYNFTLLDFQMAMCFAPELFGWTYNSTVPQLMVIQVTLPLPLRNLSTGCTSLKTFFLICVCTDGLPKLAAK